MHHHNETAKIAATHFCLGNISKCETKNKNRRKKTQQHKHAMIMYLRILINIS